jgi:NhaP-type Na+/H+ or K+/H+ antiporter
MRGPLELQGSSAHPFLPVPGNAFTWDDWFRVQTEDHAFQDVIDSLLNSAIFLYIGSILPWSEFGGDFFGIQPWRLVVLGITIMLLRRVPWVVALVRAFGLLGSL